MRTTSDLRSSRSFARAGAALAASGLIAGAALAAAGPAAALDGFSISGGTWNVRSSAGGGVVVGSISGGTPVGIDCQVVGPAVSVAGFGTSTVYDRLSGRGFVSDLAVRETAYAVRDPRLPDCGAQPAPQPAAPAATAAWGRTAPQNNGVPGQCTRYAYDRFKQATGVYPLIGGNAHAWNESAAANGWTVTSTPRARSIVVFEKGVQGAGGYGHVAWVESVQQRADGAYLAVSEMNFPTAGRVTTRTVKHVSGMSYVLAP